MRYYIDYALRCERGKVRKVNQDNFWLEGKYLESENNGLEKPLENAAENSNIPMFAVFDGMGGENHGEIAAYLAAKEFDEFYAVTPKNEIKRYLPEVCARMNTRICDYLTQNRAGYMGTTCAILAFDKKEVYICNVGDSRIYQYRSDKQPHGKLTQISKDHVSHIGAEKKPHLTQHLGIPETDFVIEPHIAYGDYSDGDKFLICSDGLTDMLTDDEIGRILSSCKTASEAARVLTETALENGGVDNVTVIVCQLRKRGYF